MPPYIRLSERLIQKVKSLTGWCGGVRRILYMTVSVHTLLVRFFGTASFGTLNVNISTVTFGTYKISVQSTLVNKCQFQHKQIFVS